MTPTNDASAWSGDAQDGIGLQWNRTRLSSETNLDSIGEGCRSCSGPDKLEVTRFSGYKFRFTSAKGACRSSAPPGPEISLNRHWTRQLTNERWERVHQGNSKAAALVSGATSLNN
ncbi:hypothetical protein TNCV_5079441 [Trichonephila clavipes]|nr:hypothetical protein TNCV_5079441 [Trichonephila clavipes]